MKRYLKTNIGFNLLLHIEYAFPKIGSEKIKMFLVLIKHCAIKLCGAVCT
jgi:hypothetical protein